MRASSTMRKVAAQCLVVLLGALTIAAFAPGQACACTCFPLTTEEAIDRTPAIIVGTATDSEELSRLESDTGGMRYTVQVSRSYKLQLPETISLLTPAATGACGITMTEGQEQLIVLGGVNSDTASGDITEVSSTICSDVRVSEAQVAQLAGPALEPISETHTADSRDWVSPWAAVGTAAALATAGGIVLLVWVLVWRRGRTGRG